MFLSSLRNIPPSRKTLILEQPAHLTAHWDMIMMESSSQFYKRIMLLIEKCEISSETVFTATRLSAGASKQPSENYRRSKDFDKASDFGLQKFSIEKENREPLIGAQAMTTLQSLQFVGGDLFHDPLTTAMNHSMTSPSTVFHELQRTYCGLGLHDRFLQKGKVLQNLNVFVEKPPKSHARNFETQVQEPETERSKSSAEQKYMNLLRNGGLALKKDTSENQKAESEPIIKKLNSKSHTEKRMASGFDESLPTERPNPSVLLKQHSELTGSASSKTTTTSKRDDSIKTSSEDQALIERNGESLFSSHLIALLDSSPSLKQLQRSEKIDHSTTSQWSTLFFTTSDLPLPELVSDYLLNSIQKNLKDPPAEIVGSPPLPLPQFPNHLQANMKSLTSIFDEHVKELEAIDCDVGMLWTQRKNLNAGSEKVLSKLRLDMTMAASHLDQFVNKIDEAKCEVDQLRHWLPIVNFVDQGTTAQHHEKVKLSEQLDLILEESSRIFQGVKEQQFRKEEIASTTEEGNFFSVLVVTSE